MRRIEESELIINKDGSIFHLNIKPEDLADDIILVGDPGRVEVVAEYFDSIEVKKSNREFHTITGLYNNKRISVISTGIGTDNIDIVVNELDALVNIDFESRTVNAKLRKLNLIRIGTTGGLQEHLNVDSFILSKMACGFDGLLNFYANRNEICNLNIEEQFKEHCNWNSSLASPYFVESSDFLREKFNDLSAGITISAPGFYGPQGRILRLNTQDLQLNEKISAFRYNGDYFSNFEMECSAIYGLSKLLGHEALTICALIANRLSKTYSKDYKPIIRKLIKLVLDRISDK